MLKDEHGTGGHSGGLENGGHERINYNNSGFDIDYSHDGVVVKERFSWDKVASRIAELIRQDSYEDSADDNNDSVIDGNSAEPEPLPFQEGDRIYYHDRVFEIVKFLHDGRTVEIGDIAQLKNLDRLKITERVPLSAIATMVVESVQSGDFSEKTKAAIQAATLANQENQEHDRALMDDFHARAWGEGFNYRYSPHPPNFAFLKNQSLEERNMKNY